MLDQKKFQLEKNSYSGICLFYVCNQNPKNRKCCCDYRHEKMTNTIVRIFFRLKCFLTKQKSFIILKVFKVKALSIFLFCLFQWTSFQLTLILKKGHRVNFFFQVSTILSYIFARYIQNLEMYFAILVYFDFGYV